MNLARRDRAEPRASAIGGDAWRVAGLWALVLVLHRAVIVILGFDGVFYWEEAYRLIAAEALVHGWDIPIGDLQADPYAGGSLVIASLAAPVVACCGATVVGLKGVAVVWSALGLLAWFVLLDRYFGRRAANVFGVCFILGPPLLVVYNVVAMGSHAEVVTLTGVQLLLAYRYVFGERRSHVSLLLWAGVAGWSVWFTYVAIVPFAIVVLAALVAGALPFRRWPVLALGFVLGLLPWIVYNWQTGWEGLAVVAATFGPPSSVGSYAPDSRFVARLLALVTLGMPAALEYHDVRVSLSGLALRIPARVFSHAYYWAFVAAWLVAVRRSVAGWRSTGGVRAWVASHPELPLLAMVPAFALVIAASNQVFDERINRLSRVPFLTFRVLVPALPAMLVAFALTVSRLRGRALGAALGGLIALGVVASARIVADGAESRPRIEREARQLGANAMGQLLYYKHGPALPVLRARAAAVDPSLRASVYRGIGFSLAQHHPLSASPSDLADRVREVPPGDRTALLEGMQTALGAGMEQVAPIRDAARVEHVRRALSRLDAANGAH